MADEYIGRLNLSMDADCDGRARQLKTVQILVVVISFPTQVFYVKKEKF